MTSAESIVKLEGSMAKIRKLMKDADGRATRIVRGNEGTIYLCMPNHELGWIDKIAKDIGVKKAEVCSLPSYGKALCGVLTVNPGKHSAQCKKCRALMPAKPHDGEVRTVIKVEGLHDLSLNGLTSLMKGKMDEAMAIAQEYDTIIKAVEKIPELETQLEVLKRQIAEHRQALKYFMKET